MLAPFERLVQEQCPVGGSPAWRPRISRQRAARSGTPHLYREDPFGNLVEILAPEDDTGDA